MPTTGEKSGVGSYTCTKCGQVVRLNESTDTLPPCQNVTIQNIAKSLFPSNEFIRCFIR